VRLAAGLVTLVLHGCGSIAESNVDRECNLKAPPAEATRARFGANDVFTYPAHPGSAYSGCSWTWMIHPDGSHYLEAVLRYREGQLISYRSTERPAREAPLVTECRYEADRLVERRTIPDGRKGPFDCPDAVEMRALLTSPAR
jgi:hypothetical protein